MILLCIAAYLFFACSPFSAGRYHSLVIEKESFPSDALEVTAWTEDGLVMAARHKVYNHLQVFFPYAMNIGHSIQLSKENFIGHQKQFDYHTMKENSTIIYKSTMGGRTSIRFQKF